MTKANNWTSIGDLAQRIACRLTAQREAQIFAGDRGDKNAAAPELGGESAAARFPGREESGHEGSRDRGMGIGRIPAAVEARPSGGESSRSHVGGPPRLEIASNPARAGRATKPHAIGAARIPLGE